jgi:hypothetical protein
MKATPENTHDLRALVRGREDIQRLRIQNGGRIVANAYAKMGISPGEKIDINDKKNKKILEKATKEYKMLTEGLTRPTAQAQLNALKKNPGSFELITSLADSTMVQNWIDLHKIENDILKAIEVELKVFDVYRHYLKLVRGIGPAISGALLSGLDIRKARYVSSLWKYCGLDVTPKTKSEKQFRFIMEADWPVRGGTKKGFKCISPDGTEKEIICECISRKGFNEIHVDSEHAFKLVATGDKIQPFQSSKSLEVIEKTDKVRFDGNFGEGRSAKKHHQVSREYTTKDGKIDEKMGLSYNPRMKTWVVGIMPDVLIQLNKHYNKLYHDHKNYLINDKRRYPNEDMTQPCLLADGHITKRAKRYIAKIFLLNFFIAWKTIEGLPIIRRGYHEEKLGKTPHPDPWFNPEDWPNVYVGPGPDHLQQQTRGQVP